MFIIIEARTHTKIADTSFQYLKEELIKDKHEFSRISVPHLLDISYAFDAVNQAINMPLNERTKPKAFVFLGAAIEELDPSSETDYLALLHSLIAMTKAYSVVAGFGLFFARTLSEAEALCEIKAINALQSCTASLELKKQLGLD